MYQDSSPMSVPCSAAMLMSPETLVRPRLEMFADLMWANAMCTPNFRLKMIPEHALYERSDVTLIPIDRYTTREIMKDRKKYHRRKHRHV